MKEILVLFALAAILFTMIMLARYTNCKMSSCVKQKEKHGEINDYYGNCSDNCSFFGFNEWHFSKR